MIIAVDADNAHEIGDHAYRSLGAKNLRLDCKLLGRRRLSVKRTAGAPAEIARRFDRGLCIGQSVSDCLVLDDRVNTATFLGTSKMKRKLERGAHQRDAEDANQCRSSCERRSRQREPGTFLSQEIVMWCRNVLEAELRHEMRPMTDGVDRTFEYKTRYRSFYRNDGDRCIRRRRWIGSAHNAENIGAFTVPARG